MKGKKEEKKRKKPKLRRLNSNVTTVILIVFTITFSAIMYFGVVPLLEPNENLILVNFELEDTEDPSIYADKLTLTVLNNGSSAITLDNLTVTRNGAEVDWLFQTQYKLEASEQTEVICLSTFQIDEFVFNDYVVITISYEKTFLILKLKVPPIFSERSFIYTEDFESFNVDNWSLTIFQDHYPPSNQDITDWEITDDFSSNNYWRCTSNNCQFAIHEDPLADITNGNISLSFRTGEDDATGLIFRYDDSGPYPNFYIVWFTDGHPSNRNGPHTEELDYFDWNTIDDQILPGKISLHYVEGDADGFNWYKLDEADWIRETDQWYTWRVVADGDNLSVFTDNAETAILSAVDDSISHGYLGLASFGNFDNHFDNLCVW